MENKFILEQKVICVNLHGYEGTLLEKRKILTINFIGENVIGFKEHIKEDGTPIKFFNHYFEPLILKKKRIFREGDKIKYNGANWTVIEQIEDKIHLSYNGGGEDNIFINVLTDTFTVIFQKLFVNDKINLVSLQSVQKYLDGDYYYMGRCATSKKELHRLYLKLEEEKYVTINKIFEEGTFATLKKHANTFYIPTEMIIILEEGKKDEKVTKGSTVIFKKGRQSLIVGNTYKVEDVLDMSSKTILGLKTDKGMIYVNQKQCKIIKIKKINEKTMVKEECTDIL